jgi:DNA-binding transcriptional ArsR family regulator
MLDAHGTSCHPHPRPAAMNDNLQPRRCAELLGALAAPERLRIVRVLRGGPRSVGEIADELGLPLVNVSHHLHVLKHARLVHSRKHGRYVLYSLPPGILQDDGTATEHLDLGCCRLEIPKPGDEAGA